MQDFSPCSEDTTSRLLFIVSIVGDDTGRATLLDEGRTLRMIMKIHNPMVMYALFSFSIFILSRYRTVKGRYRTVKGRSRTRRP